MNAEKRHIYLVGCGGVGMLWIADYALEMGYVVSGSDLVDSPALAGLRERGATIHIGVDPAAIPQNVTEAVITSAITPSAPGYAEYEELQRRGVPVLKRAAWVGKLTREKYTIAIAGAHGKTTTTAMVGWILDQAGLDPTVFVGGTVSAWGRTRIGKSKYLVLEADEFDRSFHQFSPQIAVVLNIDLDHTDYYTGGMPEIEQSYHRFLRNLPHGKGVVVAYGRNKHIRKVAKGFKYAFRWYDEQSLWPGVKVPQPGLHNLLNATAAARVAHELGIDHETIKKALATFPGVGRRMEHLGTWEQVELYDDYAHHPHEIEATLQGLRSRFAKENLTVIFQPHQRARTEALLKEFGRAFDKNSPNTLILAPIYQVAGREADSAVSHHSIAEEIRHNMPNGMKLYEPDTEEEMATILREVVQQPGIVITMGAGNIRQIVEKYR